ncbi:rhodanese-like domain-containing protein [Streptomyces marispadix]|uniref:Rhodanese-like domain-containing protein n=1 Tax=Streptomyces marispadix TaxID=2922868 RepID=A0ABS9SUZ3_9ACTN|nr:rhodanese-like domain-containing protein [Streptomyces marispadix]MCH6160094.1 rhodanese-like domain-containing protein [Streptomyces marispadix]
MPSAPFTVGTLSRRLESSTVIDVRTPGEYGAGHIPGAFNIPLDRLDEALPALRTAAARKSPEAEGTDVPDGRDGPVGPDGPEGAEGPEAAAQAEGLVVVCGSGARSATARDRLMSQGIAAVSLDGGTDAWAAAGHRLARTPGARAVWPMERQVRLAAGSLVLLGLLADLAVPGFRVLSFLIGGGLVFSALSNTCGMAAVLSKLPYNRRQTADSGLDATLATLTERSGATERKG